jgi:hopanoid biosynthesis associated RND transporter like protein HpnN
MLKSAIVHTVTFCTRHRWWVILAGVLVMIGSILYTATHFQITTDINQLISKDLPWRQRALAIEALFPQRELSIIAVVEGPTPEFTREAANRLTARLTGRSDLFKSVRQPGSGEFFDRNGLMFLPLEELEPLATRMAEAEPVTGTLAADPSLRGVLDALALGVMGVQGGKLKLDDATRPMTVMAATLEDVLAGKHPKFSWHVLLNGKADRRELHRFIEVVPILDFNALEPGAAAENGIRQAVADLKLVSELGARVRLTGPIAMADEEFATIREGALINNAVTIVSVLIILWLALRSGRIILAVFIALMMGLAATAAFGLFIVGAYNLISIAFAVLFVGIGVDFGIQFSVRYRAERFELNDLDAALSVGAGRVGGPLALAASATALGFFSFLPTDYRGLSELGQIAGSGMMIAFITSITILPALLSVLNPPGEPYPLGYAFLAPVDRFLERNRIAVVVSTIAVAVAGTPLLFWLTFDFNPINLRSPKTESIATYLDLRRDPETGVNAIQVLAPSLSEGDQMAARLSKIPEVGQSMTMSRFVPDHQDEKRALIKKAEEALDPTLNPQTVSPSPTDEDNIKALNDAADGLASAAGEEKGPGAAAAKRLREVMIALTKATPAVRAEAQAVLVDPLKIALDELRNWLRPQVVTIDTLPPDLVRDWMVPDGRARVEVTPKGDPNDNETLRAFAQAVLKVEPAAAGAPVVVLESSRTVVHAFIQAGICALLTIAALLWITLKRFTDVLLTLVPLIVAGMVTLEICVLIGLPLNFANIIALPLLLGIGVAFKIYYIMAWRTGQTSLLQSSLTRAVFFSALTTAVAFGSLWLSSHPGTSSMGKLLALSLMCTLAAAVLFQPALMGPPRVTEKE